MLVKKNSKNQITLPEEVLKQIPETDYFEVKVEKGKIVLIPVRVSHIALKKITLEKKGKKLTEKVSYETIKLIRVID